ATAPGGDEEAMPLAEGNVPHDVFVGREIDCLEHGARREIPHAHDRVGLATALEADAPVGADRDEWIGLERRWPRAIGEDAQETRLRCVEREDPELTTLGASR